MTSGIWGYSKSREYVLYVEAVCRATCTHIQRPKLLQSSTETPQKRGANNLVSAASGIPCPHGPSQLTQGISSLTSH